MVSANMVDNNNDDLCRWMEAQEKISRAQQEALENMQQMLIQFLFNRNTNDTGSNRDEEEHNNDEHPKTDKSMESSIDAEVIKGIQAYIAPLIQRDELKMVGMTRSYPLEWDSMPYLLKFKPPMSHTYDDNSSPNQHIYYFRS